MDYFEFDSFEDSNMKIRMLIDEEWRVIALDNRYYVSNFGRIKHIKKDRLLKLRHRKSGYNTVTLDKNQQSVHVLLAKAFISNPENKKVVDHINGIRHDNHISNLRWATHHENNMNTIRPTIKSRRQILQYDLNGTYIKTFNCREEAANTLMYPSLNSEEEHLKLLFKIKRNISKSCLSNKKYANFKWKYYEYPLLENEEFKTITINNKEFCVSNKGRIKDTRNKISFGNKAMGYNFYYGKGVHILVATAFIPKTDPLKIIVNHIDGNGHNNDVSNLEWATPRENCLHACYILGYGLKPVQQICMKTNKVIKEFISIKEAVEETGTDRTSIGQVCSGKQKTANGFYWKLIKKTI